jgi:hypothetical protein
MALPASTWPAAGGESPRPFKAPDDGSGAAHAGIAIAKSRRHSAFLAPTTVSKESVMNPRQVISLTALALATGAAFADAGPLTRAEVKNQFVAARAAGELTPAGQRTEPGVSTSAPSRVARSQVKSQARQVYATKAKSINAFEVAGNNAQALDYAQQESARSTLSRADMRAATRAARFEGQLMGSGEESYRADNPELHANGARLPVVDRLVSLRGSS